MRKGLFLAAALAVLAGTAGAASAAEERWVVVYTEKPSVAEFRDYGLVVLDSVHHPPIAPLLEQKKTVIGYISLGEVENYRDYYKAVEAEGILYEKNPNWPDSRYIDVRDARWTRRVVEDLVPRLLRKGFQGIFIDTLDNPAELERRDPAKFKGMTEAAARLVTAIRRHYPRMYIMLNRSYEILPAVEGQIDAVLGESVFTEIDFEKKGYRLADAKTYQLQVKWLKDAKARRPGLKVYTLDYWPPADAAGVARIYAEQRKNGFIPYVSVKDLDRVLKEPAR
ncbi:MAG: endo alpha-1,4 polygalactosaminidase [Candidatus Odyssella sp.]|nr:endo alpha-1,4 polygalactosaminidase [Candidatus Odyssella sp.]